MRQPDSLPAGVVERRRLGCGKVALLVFPKCVDIDLLADLVLHRDCARDAGCKKSANNQRRRALACGSVPVAGLANSEKVN